MQPFDYRRVQSAAQAFELAKGAQTAFVAGATDFMQLWKVGVEHPSLVVDIGALSFRDIEVLTHHIFIGGLATMSEVATNATVHSEYPMIAEALLASASPQVRNVATIGGNLLQRTRCDYFRSGDLPCNKRKLGSGCGALEGENRLHAIFGGSKDCVATHASDLAVALRAARASVRLRSATRERSLAFDDLYVQPDANLQRESNLERGELIVAVELPRLAQPRRSHYLKVRDRASFEFAVVSVAASLEIKNELIVDASIVAGGVGTIPWRLRATESELNGSRLEQDVFRRAAERAVEGAQPLSHNGFKVELLKRAVLRTLEVVGGAK